MRDIANPTIYIDFIRMKTPTNSSAYKKAYQEAQECLSLLHLISDDSRMNAENTAATGSTADEILKYKNLLDMGAISQEEFAAKEKQLLDL